MKKFAANCAIFLLLFIPLISKSQTVWHSEDIGSVAAAGSTTIQGGKLIIRGSGEDIWGTADEFHYFYKNLSGDIDAVIKVDSLELVDNSTKVGIMVRESNAANSKHVTIFSHAGASFGIGLQRRTSTGGNSEATNVAGYVPPGFLRLVRSGDTFTSYVSLDSAEWFQLGDPVTTTMSTALVGIAITSNIDGSVAKAVISGTNLLTFETAPQNPTDLIGSIASQTEIQLSWNDNSVNEDGFILERKHNEGAYQHLDSLPANSNSYADINVSAGSTYSYRIRTYNSYGNSGYAEIVNMYISSPSDWTSEDIGGVDAAGSVTIGDGKMIIRASGDDIWGSADDFHYYYRTAEGDIDAIIKVDSIEFIANSTKVGLMIRESNAANSKHASLFAHAGSNFGVSLQRRTSTGGNSAASNAAGILAPIWLRMTKSGNDFAAYSSANGTDWTQVGPTLTVSMTNPLVGIAMTSNIDGSLAEAVISQTNLFDLGTPAGPIAPSGLASALTSENEIELTWTDNSNNEEGFVLERKTGTGSFEFLDSLSANVASYLDSTVTVGNSYQYRMLAFNSTGASAYSNETTSITIPNSSPEGLIVNLPFAGNANDVTGNGHNGTITGATLTTDRMGAANSAYQFDGVDDLIIIPDDPQLTVEYVTLSAWVYLDSYKNDERIISKEYGTAYPQSSYTMMMSGPGYKHLQMRVGVNGAPHNRYSTSEIPLHTWTHLAATYDGDRVRLYINGTLDATHDIANGTLHPNSNPIYVGGSQFYPRNFQGKIDEVRVYNQALSTADILALYESSNGAIEAPADLTASQLSTTSVSLAWTDHSDNETGFRIERKTNEGTFEILHETTADATSYTDNAVAQGNVYTYRIKAINSSAESFYSNEAEVILLYSSGGLVLHLPFDGNGNDMSGNSNHATLNGPQLTSDHTGVANQAYQFDGTNDNMQIAHNFSQDADYVTLSAWIYPTSYTNDPRIISKETGGSEPYSSYTLMLSGEGDRYLYLRIGAVGLHRQGFSTTEIPLNTWTHVAASYDGTQMKMYINGQLDATQPMAYGEITKTTNPIYIGASQFHNPRFFPGNIDEVRVYNRALTDEEVEGLYMGGYTFPEPPELTATLIGTDSVQLTWTADTANLQGYVLEKKINEGAFTLLDSLDRAITAYTDNTIAVNNQYTYRIKAYNPLGASGYSNEDSVWVEPTDNLVPDSVEYAALMALYYATGGPNWNNNTNWGNTEVSFNEWYGVNVDVGGNTPRDVLSLSLGYNNLIDSIPPEIGNLKQLNSFLALLGNNLTFIPNEMGNLDSLKTLVLNNNQLKSIPSTIGNLQKLEYLHFQYNDISSIPVETGNLSNLKWVDFSGNKISELPKELAQIPHLTELRILDNHLTDVPNEFVELENITFVFGLNRIAIQNFEKFYDENGNLKNNIVMEPGTQFNVPIQKFNTVVEGTSLNLNSNIGGIGTTHIWLRYDTNPTSQVENENDSVLIFENIQLSNAGKYVCRAENQRINCINFTDTFYVSVIEPLSDIINNYDAVLYVTMDGNDTAATVNDPVNAWALPHVASVQAHTLAQSDTLKYLVYVRKGTYEDYWVSMPGIDMYFEEDAVVWYNTDSQASRSIISDWRGGAGEYNIYGKGRFYVTNVDGFDDRDAVNFRYNSTLSIQCAEFNSLQLWSQFTSSVTFDSVTFRTSSISALGEVTMFNNCTFNHGYAAFARKREIFNNCTFILPDSSEIDASQLVVNHLGDSLFRFTLRGRDMKLNTFNYSHQEMADILRDSYTADIQQVGCFEFHPAKNPWQGWNAGKFDFSFELTNPTFIVNRPNGFALRVIWNEMNPTIDYEQDGITINGGQAIAGPNGATPIFFQADKRDSLAGDIPIHISGITYDGFTERVIATDYFPMGVRNEGLVPDSVEYAALMALYNSTDGPNWNNQQNWGNLSVLLDEWHGVYTENGDVTDVYLYNNNLSGYIPGAFGNLTNLKYAYFDSNNITSIASGFGNLINLRELWIYENSLTALPEDFGNLSNLEQLWIYENDLESFPAGIGNLTRLEEIWAYSNNLSSLPSEIGNLNKLKQLWIYDNALGNLPAEIGMLDSLEILAAGQNSIVQIPIEIGNLKNLRGLHLEDNIISQVPVEIGEIERLEQLNLSNNDISIIPNEIGNLQSLFNLMLNDNQLSALTASIGNLSGLSFLELNNNLLESIPEEVSNITGLRRIELENNLLQEIPEGLSELPELRYVFLDNNRLAKLPINFSDLPVLYRMEIVNNTIPFDYLEQFYSGPGVKTVPFLLQSPQKAIPVQPTNQVEQGGTLVLSSNIGGVYTHYNWQKFVDGTWTSIGADDPLLTISNIQFSDAGQYRCVATNDWVTDLTLYTETFTVSVDGISSSTVLFARASGDWHNSENWSATPNGPSAGIIPQEFHTVVIDGAFDISSNNDVEIADLYMNHGASNSSLTIGADFIVNGSVRFLNGASIGKSRLYVAGAGRLEVRKRKDTWLQALNDSVPEHNYESIYLVDPETGNDQTAEANSLEKPFKTILAAISAARQYRDATGNLALVYIRKGTYQVPGVPGIWYPDIHLYVEETTLIWSTGQMLNNNNGPGTYKIYGNGRFHCTRVVPNTGLMAMVVLNRNTDIYLEADEVDSFNSDFNTNGTTINIKNTTFRYAIGVGGVNVNLENCTFKSGHRGGGYSIGVVNHTYFAKNCTYILPSDGVNSLDKVYDHEGNLKFTQIYDGHYQNQLETSQMTHQEVVDYFTNGPNDYIGSAVFTFNMHLQNNWGNNFRKAKITLEDCRFEINKEKCVGIKIVQNFNREEDGKIEIINPVVIDNTSSETSAIAIYKRNTVTSDFLITIQNITHSCDHLRGNTTKPDYLDINYSTGLQ